MRLPKSLREALMEELETYIEAVDEPEIEVVAEYVIEQLQMAEEEHDLDDIASAIEDESGLDAWFGECLEEALQSKGDFVFTAEEVVSVFEQLGAVEWVDDSEFEPED